MNEAEFVAFITGLVIGVALGIGLADVWWRDSSDDPAEKG
jgi:hypothetical protein